jgi:hypothetical protein
MPLNKEDLIKLINLDEPDYNVIVNKLSADDIPTLVELSKDANPAIATKAISCLGHLKSERALIGLQEVVNHPDPVRRVAVANSLKNLAAVQGAVQMLDKLLDDQDIGVRKFALKTVEAANITQLKGKVQTFNQREDNSALKNLSQEILQKLK